VLYADDPGASCTTSDIPLTAARFPTTAPLALSARLNMKGGPSRKQLSPLVLVK
jgi:hypothetical protein